MPLGSAIAKLSKLPLKAFEPATRKALFGDPAERIAVSPFTANHLKTGIDSGRIAEVSIEGQAGSLHGHFHKSTAAAHTGKTVLFLSGSGSSAEDLSVDIAGKYCNEGVDVLSVNYRGFGKSQGVPSEDGLLRDAESMLDFLVKQKGIAPENIIVHGYSLGGPVAAHVAKMSACSEQPLGGLVLDRPMVSASKSAKAHGAPLPKLSGQILKATQGSFSVNENLQGMPVSMPIVLMTDGEGLGVQGEALRQRLVAQGFKVTGHRLECEHLDSMTAMEGAFDTIQQSCIDVARRDPQAP
ncbi:MAG TPA: alpha/beta hydrolase [Burkholderiaceae bacterium]|nr:alpha/beta hydrolase [Burkholderiaceae bacterium]